MTESLFDLDLEDEVQSGDPLKDEYNLAWKPNGFSHKAFLRWRAIPSDQWEAVIGDLPEPGQKSVPMDPEWANEWADDGTTVTEPLEAMVWHRAGVEPGQAADVKAAFDVVVPGRAVLPAVEALVAAGVLSLAKAGMDLTGLIRRGDSLSPEILAELLMATTNPALQFSSSEIDVVIESAHRLTLTGPSLDTYRDTVVGIKAVLRDRGWLLSRTQWVAATMAVATDVAVGHRPADIFEGCDTLADLNLKLTRLSDLTWAKR